MSSIEIAPVAIFFFFLFSYGHFFSFDIAGAQKERKTGLTVCARALSRERAIFSRRRKLREWREREREQRDEEVPLGSVCRRHTGYE